MTASAVQLRTPGLHSECYSLLRIAGLWGSGFRQYWQGHFQQHHCSGRHPLLHHHSMSSMRHHFCSGWPLLAWGIPLPVQVVRAMHAATPLAYLSLRKAVCLCVSGSLCLLACLPACLCAAPSRADGLGGICVSVHALCATVLSCSENPHHGQGSALATPSIDFCPSSFTFLPAVLLHHVQVGSG